MKHPIVSLLSRFHYLINCACRCPPKALASRQLGRALREAPQPVRVNLSATICAEDLLSRESGSARDMPNSFGYKTEVSLKL